MGERRVWFKDFLFYGATFRLRIWYKISSPSWLKLGFAVNRKVGIDCSVLMTWKFLENFASNSTCYILEKRKLKAVYIYKTLDHHPVKSNFKLLLLTAVIVSTKHRGHIITYYKPISSHTCFSLLRSISQKIWP